MTEQELTTIEKKLEIVETHEDGHEMLFWVVPDLIAEIRRLQKERADAPIVFWPDNQSDTPRFRDMGTAQKIGDTHTARLVDIQEIKK